METALRYVGFALGTAAFLFLAVLLARRFGAGWAHRLGFGAAAAAAAWHGANFAAEFCRLAGGSAGDQLLSQLETAAAACGWILCPLALGFLWAVRRERRFAVCLAGALAVVAAARALAGADSAALAFSTLAPAACLAHHVYRYNILGLAISRRVIFALTLGSFAALYLFLVGVVADYVEKEYLTIAALVKVPLILAAAMIWLPLNAAMTRILSRRSRLYREFSRQLIEEAAGKFSLDERLQYLASQVGKSFRLKRVLLAASGQPPVYGHFGEPRYDPTAQELGMLAAPAGDPDFEIAHVDERGPAGVRRFLERTGYHYLFPLRYEGGVVGFLLLDVRPRRLLDEDESVLIALGAQISHSIETCRVIESKIKLERALVQQEHMASLGMMARSIAHGFKNPLSSIKSLAQTMSKDAGIEPLYARDLGYIIREADRLDRSVRQLLDWIRRGQQPEEEVNVSGLLEETARLLAWQQGPGGVRIQTSIQPGLKLSRANPEAIQQIVSGIMENAVEATVPAGLVSLKAALGAGGSIAVSITDTGPGILPSKHDDVFKPFYTTKQKGTGLGLAIVKKYVDSLGGEIDFESPVEDGHGVRFRVTIPMR